MQKNAPDVKAQESWVLVQGARQLLTLRGPTGPRRGPDLRELGIVHDAAVLIRNGVIEEVGPSRRVGNLIAAKHAKVIDVRGQVVMPAYVDPDNAVALPAMSLRSDPGAPKETSLHLLSKQRLATGAESAASQMARYGILTAGCHTRHAPDLRTSQRILRLHRQLQNKPLRIRSVLAPCCPEGAECLPFAAEVGTRWLAAVRSRKLASVLELISGDTTGGAFQTDQLESLGVAASSGGFALRLRCAGEDIRNTLAFARRAGAISVTFHPGVTTAGYRWDDTGFTTVFGAGGAEPRDTDAVRTAIDGGAAVALASGYQTRGVSHLNPQYLMYLAVTRCRMSPEEAILATTYNAACALRMSHVTGSIEPGKSADLLVMDVGDYTELWRRPGNCDISMTMRAGHILWRRESPRAL